MKVSIFRSHRGGKEVNFVGRIWNLRIIVPYLRVCLWRNYEPFASFLYW